MTLLAGPGEPGATAAGILGIMSIWRCFYSAFLDVLNSGRWSYLEARIDRLKVAWSAQQIWVLCYRSLLVAIQHCI